MELISHIGIAPFTLLHILGVAFGLGIATGMDVLLIRNILRDAILTETQVSNLILLSRFVSIALIMLWLSGTGFLLYYAEVSPEKLLNPKIWSKLSIVLILTVNGVVIHHAVLPKLQQGIGQTLLGSLPYRTLALLLASGAVSFVSWYFPFIYGTVPALNFAFSFAEFSIAYIATLVAAILTGLAALGFLYAHSSGNKVAKPLTLNNKVGLGNKHYSKSNLVPVNFGLNASSSTPKSAVR